MTNAGEKEVLLELKRRLVYLLRSMGIKNGAQFPIRIHVEIHSLVIGTMEYAVGGVIRGVAVLGVEPFSPESYDSY